MSLPITHEQESLSLAYISAIASRVAVQCTVTGKIEYGVDVYMQTLTQFPELLVPNNPPVCVQVKATKNWQETNGYIVYDMQVDAYQKLYYSSAHSRLFLLCLPEAYDDWVDVSAERLIVRKCCYWYKVTEPTENKATQRIFIPSDQRVTIENLQEIIDQARLEKQ